MNLKQIEAFRSVMRLGSMIAAADVLYTAQPSPVLRKTPAM